MESTDNIKPLEILDYREDPIQYLVKWNGPKEDSWEDAQTIEDEVSPLFISAYFDRHCKPIPARFKDKFPETIRKYSGVMGEVRKLSDTAMQVMRKFSRGGKGHPGEVQADPDTVMICVRNVVVGLFVGAWLVFVFLIMIGQKVQKSKSMKEDL